MKRATADGRNVVLIGMPGVGKSTVGVLLAKAMSRDFLDTDVYIQAHECRRLQDLLDELGREAFLRLEEGYLMTLDREDCVIATGGSAVYSAPAMEHLGASGVRVHLELPLEDLERRISNLHSRGVVMTRDQTLRGLFEEREPLYREYADVTVDCRGLTHDETVRAVLEAVARHATQGR